MYYTAFYVILILMSNNTLSRTVGNKLSTKEKGIVMELIVTLLLKQYRTSEVIREVQAVCKLSERSISTYITKCREMIAQRPLETVDRAKRILYTELEELQRTAEHTRDKIDIIKYKAKLLGLDDTTVNVHHHKHQEVPTEKLIEVALEPDDTD